MNKYDLLKVENEQFWAFLDRNKTMFSAQDLAYWEDEENNALEELSELEVI